jgi:hypothetical protein
MSDKLTQNGQISDNSLKEDNLTDPVYTRHTVTDTDRHVDETQNGHKVTKRTSETERTEQLEKFDSRVKGLIEQSEAERKAAEDIRANRRNRNRILILVTVLIMELVVPTLYTWHLIPALFIKYEVLAITLPDALLTVYAWRKRY